MGEGLDEKYMYVCVSGRVGRGEEETTLHFPARSTVCVRYKKVSCFLIYLKWSNQQVSKQAAIFSREFHVSIDGWVHIKIHSEGEVKHMVCGPNMAWSAEVVHWAHGDHFWGCYNPCGRGSTLCSCYFGTALEPRELILLAFPLIHSQKGV